MFSVVAVEKIDAPEGLDGTWYRYVIDRESSSTIVGSRRGSMRAVKRHAQLFAEDLNLRIANGGKSMWSPRQKKPATSS
ncbi:MAG: hypothetical protein O7G84_20095 [Gammaproteobacteria bacterium]|jgi:hypothetical protein|nr:hypothetical protein [Gammaproteobacteria bacterium]